MEKDFANTILSVKKELNKSEDQIIKESEDLKSPKFDIDFTFPTE